MKTMTAAENIHKNEKYLPDTRAVLTSVQVHFYSVYIISIHTKKVTIIYVTEIKRRCVEKKESTTGRYEV